LLLKKISIRISDRRIYAMKKSSIEIRSQYGGVCGWFQAKVRTQPPKEYTGA
jgi:hypothetical protein